MIPNQTKLDLIQTKKQKNKIVKKRFIPVNEPIFIGNEIKYLKNCISSKWIGSDGKYVSEFEKKLSNYTKRKYAIAVKIAVMLTINSFQLCFIFNSICFICFAV